MMHGMITYLEVPCPITRNPVAVHAISRVVEILAGCKLNVLSEERVLEEEINRCDWIAIVQNEGVLGGVTGHRDDR